LGEQLFDGKGTAEAQTPYLARNGVDVSVFDADQGHLPGYAAAVNPLPDAFHSVNAHVRFDPTNHQISAKLLRNEEKTLGKAAAAGSAELASAIEFRS
jgi:hypothetical protein